MYPNNIIFDPKLIFFWFYIFFHFDKFESPNFKYDDSFLQNLAKITQMRYFSFKIQVL